MALGSFGLFYKMFEEELRAEAQLAFDTKLEEIPIIVLEAWNRLSEEEKAYYEEAADDNPTVLADETSTNTSASDCAVCMDAPKNMLLRPCKHLATCFRCSANLEICPICRTPIELREKIFLA